jgi:hypothetical protein
VKEGGAALLSQYPAVGRVLNTDVKKLAGDALDAGKAVLEGATQEARQLLGQATEHLPLKWSADPGANLGNLELRGGSNSPASAAAEDEIELVLQYKRNLSHPPDEFASQATTQGEALGTRKAGEIRTTIEKVKATGRLAEADEAAAAARRSDPVAAEGKDALHPADSCIGGDPCKVSGFGHSGVNRSIGRQNRLQQETVYDAVKDADPNARVKVRVELSDRKP